MCVVISGYRYYSAELGRWINTDPIEELGSQLLRNGSKKQSAILDLYIFVSNNPIMFHDLLGLTEDWLLYDENGNIVGEIGIDAPLVDIIDVAEILLGFGVVNTSMKVICTRKIARESAEMLTGPFGKIPGKTLARLAESVGPKTKVFTKLTRAPQPGTPLSVAIGENSEIVMKAVREGGQVFSADIPTSLIKALEKVGLAEEKILIQEGANVIAKEIRFHPAATKYIVNFL